MQPSADLSSLHRFSSTLLQRVAGDDRKGNVLVLGHGAMPPPDCPGLLRDEHSFGLAICIFQGPLQYSPSRQRLLDCASTALPFQDAAFRTVILYLITRDGAEQELSEGCRVLAPGGALVVLGLNCRSWSGINARRRGPVPGMQVAAVRERLQSNEMAIDCTLGAGLLGKSIPMMEWNTLSGVALPFADLVVIRAKHRDRPVPTRLRLKEIPARIVPTAISNA